MKDYEFHPVSELFPLLQGAEFDALVEDIRQNGLREPITLKDGRILDGRNRFLACKMAGIVPRFCDCDGNGSAVALVVSANLRRRHLTPAQKAAAAVDALAFYEAEARERERLSNGRGKKGRANVRYLFGKASECAARDFAVGARSIEELKAIKQKAPALFEDVKAGKRTIFEARLKLVREEHAGAVLSLPKGKFRVLYADPPWPYGQSLEKYGAAAGHYPSMTLEDLCTLRVADIAAEESVLFMWATVPLLEKAFAVLDAWGFVYKTHIVWDKIRHNFGHYLSVRHELLMLGTRGGCLPDSTRLFDSVVSIERTREHSEKPEQFRELIDTLYPRGPRVELFARGRPAKGWETWGNEAEHREATHQ